MPPYAWAVDPNNNNAKTGEIIDQGNNNAIVCNIAAGQFVEIQMGRVQTDGKYKLTTLAIYLFFIM